MTLVVTFPKMVWNSERTEEMMDCGLVFVESAMEMISHWSSDVSNYNPADDVPRC